MVIRRMMILIILRMLRFHGIYMVILRMAYTMYMVILRMFVLLNAQVTMGPLTLNLPSSN